MKKALPFFIIPAILIVTIYFIFMSGAKKRQVSAATLTEKMMLDTFKRIDVFYEKCGNYPTTKQGLSVMLFGNSQMPECAQNVTSEYFIKNKLPTDAWGLAMFYENTGSEIKLISYGTDKVQGGEGSAADIVKTKAIGGQK